MAMHRGIVVVVRNGSHFVVVSNITRFGFISQEGMKLIMATGVRN